MITRTHRRSIGGEGELVCTLVHTCTHTGNSVWQLFEGVDIVNPIGEREFKKQIKSWGQHSDSTANAVLNVRCLSANRKTPVCVAKIQNNTGLLPLTSRFSHLWACAFPIAQAFVPSLPRPSESCDLSHMLWLISATRGTCATTWIHYTRP